MWAYKQRTKYFQTGGDEKQMRLPGCALDHTRQCSSTLARWVLVLSLDSLAQPAKNHLGMRLVLRYWEACFKLWIQPGIQMTDVFLDLRPLFFSFQPPNAYISAYAPRSLAVHCSRGPEWRGAVLAYVWVSNVLVSTLTANGTELQSIGMYLWFLCISKSREWLTGTHPTPCSRAGCKF